MGAAETSANATGDDPNWVATAFDIQGLRGDLSSLRAFHHPVIEDLARGGWPPARVGLFVQLQAPLVDLWQSAVQQCVASAQDTALLFAHAEMLAELCGRGQVGAAFGRRYQQMLASSGLANESALGVGLSGVMEHASARLLELCTTDELIGAGICGLALPWLIEAKFERLRGPWQHACGPSAGVAGAFADVLADTRVDRSRRHRAAMVAQRVTRSRFQRLRAAMVEGLDALALIDDQVGERLGVAWDSSTSGLG